MTEVAITPMQPRSNDSTTDDFVFSNEKLGISPEAAPD